MTVLTDNRFAVNDVNRLPVGQAGKDNRGDDGRHFAFDGGEVHVQQRLSGSNARPFFNQQGEAFAVQLDGIQPDVDEDFQTVVRFDADGVFGREDCGNRAVDRAYHLSAMRADGEGRAQGAAGKGRVGDGVGGQDVALQLRSFIFLCLNSLYDGNRYSNKL